MACFHSHSLTASQARNEVLKWFGEINTSNSDLLIESERQGEINTSAKNKVDGKAWKNKQQQSEEEREEETTVTACLHVWMDMQVYVCVCVPACSFEQVRECVSKCDSVCTCVCTQANVIPPSAVDSSRHTAAGVITHTSKYDKKKWEKEH